MRADDGRVEHLHEMRPLAQGGERFEESFEHAAAAQAPEALPDAVPGAELGRQRSPRNVVDREIVQGFEKLAVVPPLVPTPRAAGMKHLDTSTQSSSVIFVSMAGPPKASHP